MGTLKALYNIYQLAGGKLAVERMPGKGVSTYGGGVWCGPGWGFTKEEFEAGLAPEGVDAIDRACRRHDFCYGDKGYLTRECNLQLGSELVAIVKDPGASVQQRFDAAVMAAVFEVEANSVDLPVSAYRSIRDGIYGALLRGATFLEAIQQQMVLQQIGPMGGGSW